MDSLLYKLDSFEGPLDLLLTLIKKNKVSIYDIPIVEITEQYLEAIDGIEESDLEYTSEFLVMAAQLLYIKSKLLLPRDEDDDEEDPREDLANRLIEYQKYKEASHELRKTEFSSRYMVFREEEQIKFPIPEYSHEHPISELLDAFSSIMARQLRKKPVEKRAFSGIVGREKVSVGDMTRKIRSILSKNKRATFRSLFKCDDSRPEMIATFLAVLEMIKLNQIRADYDENTEDFIISSLKQQTEE